jgi:uncharacterized membrane protein YkvA (DUF1232 family)
MEQFKLTNPEFPEHPKPSLTEKWKQRTRQLKSELFALYLAYKDPRTPWFARLCAALVVGYAFSPIDLIPDFIPIVGYLDDLILIPVGIWLALRMIPADVMVESRARAKQDSATGRPVNRAVAVVIVIIWLVLASLLIIWGYRLFSSSNFDTSLRWASGRI